MARVLRKRGLARACWEVGSGGRWQEQGAARYSSAPGGWGNDERQERVGLECGECGSG